MTFDFPFDFIEPMNNIDWTGLNIWVNLLAGRKDKFSCKLYFIRLSFYKTKLLIFGWLEYIVKILNRTVFSFIFEDQLALDEKYLKKYIKNIFLAKIKSRIRDQAIQRLRLYSKKKLIRIIYESALTVVPVFVLN